MAGQGDRRLDPGAPDLFGLSTVCEAGVTVVELVVVLAPARGHHGSHRRASPRPARGSPARARPAISSPPRSARPREIYTLGYRETYRDGYCRRPRESLRSACAPHTCF